jgi:hypothetical protein
MLMNMDKNKNIFSNMKIKGFNVNNIRVFSISGQKKRKLLTMGIKKTVISSSHII